MPSFRIEYENQQDQRVVTAENQHRAVESFVANRSWSELESCAEDHYKGWSRLSVCVSPPIACADCESTEKDIAEEGYGDAYEDLCAECHAKRELKQKIEALGKVVAKLDPEGKDRYDQGQAALNLRNAQKELQMLEHGRWLHPEEACKVCYGQCWNDWCVADPDNYTDEDN
jgi:hypothetical protein